IRNLKVGSNGFIENTETNQFAVISHLGFDNVRMSHRFIRIDHGYIEYVYINGVVNAKRNTTVHVRPMHVAVGTGPSGDTIANVYSNLFIDNTSDSFQLGDNNSQVSY
ncbi:MAG: hypothetical protein HAW66_07935, partial [Shewanella sp.]|nr:hypothetical protein [Shewanella sp.]